MTGGQPLVSRLRAVIATKDEQIAVLQAPSAGFGAKGSFAARQRWKR